MPITKSLTRIMFQVSPQPVRHWVRDRLPVETVKRLRRMLSDRQVRRFQAAVRARKLESKLWGGFSEQALIDLEALKADPEADAKNVAYAAWALARWYFAFGNTQAAYENVLLMREADEEKQLDVGQILLETDCLLKQEKCERARERVKWALETKGDMAHLIVALANTYALFEGALSDEQDVRRLEVINTLFEREGFVPLRKQRVDAALGLDNLGADTCRSTVSAAEQPLVSIVIPAYEAETTLPVALDSLLAQSWLNLEIIVVDDVSPDATLAVAKAYAAHDSRVKAVQPSRNGGAYAARNFGLSHATGDFVTTHDSDDWSHPQKIEVQVRHLMENPEVPASVTHWVRAFPHLFFRGTSRPSKQMIQWNHSSLMLRRELFDELGGWDEVRLSADTELIRRLEAFRGEKAVERLFPGVPLAFALEDPGSLTRGGKTHARTMFHGVRREYHEAARFWREHGTPGDLAVQPGSAQRPFPAPGFARSVKEECVAVDLLVVMDFNIGGGAYVSTMNYVQAALNDGLRVGVFQWRRYDLDVTKPLRQELRQMAHEGLVRVITPGEAVEAPIVLVGYPVPLQYAIDLPPELRGCQGFYIITNQMAARLYSGGDVQYDPETVSANVERLFGITPRWIPISGLVRDLMQRDGRYKRIHDEAWTPLIDTRRRFQRPLEWRGRNRRRPVIGRHARDHYTKWPSTPGALRDAYCVDRKCDVHLLGGADGAVDILGRRPRNWRVRPFGSMNADEFLEHLDFFVHYPHEDYIEEFGRAVIEAMAAGVPAILPPVFERTFGEAALYAPPEEVWPTIERVWRDEQAYRARAQAGRAFVERDCAWHQWSVRFERLRAVGSSRTHSEHLMPSS